MTTALVNAARTYLKTFEGVDDLIIDDHLSHWKRLKHQTINDVYKALLNHAKNRHSLPKTIGSIDPLNEVFFMFDPIKVLSVYRNYEDLLNEILRQGINTPANIDISNSRSHWVIYAKSAISSAKFLDMFKNIEEFDQFIESFYCNSLSRLALPLLLKEEIFGYGFALACDFLKESGYCRFVKPDTHLNDICRQAGITISKSDFGVFKDVLSYCDTHDLVPYEFDKLIWLVGSGDFYLKNLKVPTDKGKFIKQYIALD